MSSTRAYIALWIGLAVVAAGASWTGWTIGLQHARAQPPPLVVVLHGAPVSVRCEPAAACVSRQNNAP